MDGATMMTIRDQAEDDQPTDNRDLACLAM
jgi:hypothetical protein